MKLVDNELVLVELGTEDVEVAVMVATGPKMVAASEWSESTPCCETALWRWGWGLERL